MKLRQATKGRIVYLGQDDIRVKVKGVEMKFGKPVRVAPMGERAFSGSFLAAPMEMTTKPKPR